MKKKKLVNCPFFSPQSNCLVSQLSSELSGFLALSRVVWFFSSRQNCLVSQRSAELFGSLVLHQVVCTGFAALGRVVCFLALDRIVWFLNAQSNCLVPQFSKLSALISQRLAELFNQPNCLLSSQLTIMMETLFLYKSCDIY